MSRIERISIEGIDVGARLRPINEPTVVSLMESIKRLDQLQPISVFSRDDCTILLVAGAHRLEAIKRLGLDEIDVIFVTGDEVERELCEIAENLHRAELTALERDVQIARWAELTAVKGAQIAPPFGGQQPNDKGIKKVARDLGIERTDVQRAVKVASLSEEAKRAARDAGLDDNRTALLDAARETTPAAQVAKLNAKTIDRQLKAAGKKSAEALPNPVAADLAALIPARESCIMAVREMILNEWLPRIPSSDLVQFVRDLYEEAYRPDQDHRRRGHPARAAWRQTRNGRGS
jgi:ParB family chromosome partitioning protein